MTKKTVFIIGAGASKEAGLPIGAELKIKIAELLDIDFHYSVLKRGSSFIVDALRIKAKQLNNNSDINPYLSQARHIYEALPQAISIDNFIDNQENNEKIALCGKLGIVESILNAERDSLLNTHSNDPGVPFDFTRLEKSWYTSFFQRLTENCSKEHLTKRFQSVTLIIFNYDRCVEHFMLHALRNYYRVTFEEAANLVNEINIYHPYGDVGTLPFMGKRETVAFGERLGAQKLLTIAENIKTFTEGTDPDSSDIRQIRQRMNELDRLVFIGFAFHPLNIQLITPEGITKRSVIECFATSLGISDNDQNIIKSDVKSLYKREIRISMSSKTSYEFFNEFARSLSFSNG